MILVTGATGLVGTHLLIHLAQEQPAIRALYRTETKRDFSKKIFFDYLIEEKNYSRSTVESYFSNIQWVQTSLEDIAGLKEAFQGVHYVYHCAALISFAVEDYKQLRKTNIEGTANIVNFCVQFQVQKLCYVSSIAALGNSMNGNLLDETSEWNPEASNSVYAITKYGAELEVWRGSQEGLDVVIINPGVIIGTGLYSSGSGVLFDKVYTGLAYYTQGSTGFVGVQDVVRTMIVLMETEIRNERYVLVTENLRYQEVLSKIANALGKKEPHKEASEFMLRIYQAMTWIGSTLFGGSAEFSSATVKSLLTESVYDTTKIKTVLAFEFVSIDTVIEKTANHFLKTKNHRA